MASMPSFSTTGTRALKISATEGVGCTGPMQMPAITLSGDVEARYVGSMPPIE